MAVSQTDQFNGQYSPFYFQGQRAIKYPTSSSLKAIYNPIVNETGKREFALIVNVDKTMIDAKWWQKLAGLKDANEWFWAGELKRPENIRNLLSNEIVL